MPRRHSQNNAAGAFFTHFEKQQLKGTYGTQKQRLNKDALKQFDACSLCLHPFVNPLADKNGHVYCKQCIYQYLLDQKKFQKLKMKEYKQQKEALEMAEKSVNAEQQLARKESFAKRENEIAESSGATKANSFRSTSLNAFWLPSKTPEAKPTLIAKPPKTIESPFGHPIKLKDLVSLSLTPIPPESAPQPEVAPDTTDDIDGTDDTTTTQPSNNNAQTEAIRFGRYMCPICNKSLNNVPGVCCITSTGHVFCQTCMDNFIKKDMTCPITSTTFTEKEILVLESEGTAFAGRTGSKLEAKVKTPAPRF